MVQLAEVSMCQAASIADGYLTVERHVVHAPQHAAVRGRGQGQLLRAQVAECCRRQALAPEFPLDQLGDQVVGCAQVRCAHVGLEDREQGGGMSEQQAFAPVKPEQVGVPVPGIWWGSWSGGGARAEDSQQLLRAEQNHQPIIGARGAPDACQDVAAARPASVPKTRRPDRFCPTVWMPARNLRAPRDAAVARRILLDGLARDSEVSELAGELASAPASPEQYFPWRGLPPRRS